MSLGVEENSEVAEILEDVANLLEIKRANPFRVSAYRVAAREIRDLEEPVAELYRKDGQTGLRRIYGVGNRLAGSISEILETGRLGMLDRLQSEISPVDVFTQLPGVGERLAERIIDELDVRSLEELEQAAYEGHLEDVSGVGPKKAEGIGHALVGLINRGARRRARRRLQGREKTSSPPVELLLAIDAEYRQRARADQLRRITPRRHNPEAIRWLPIMEVAHEGWEFTALFSNTRRAHELGKTRDWVVIYSENADDHQYTVVTATSGPLRGKRVVRGREAECRRYYASRSSGDAHPQA